MRVELFKVPVYFLNADFDYRNLLDFTAPDPDCLHTVIGVVVEMMLVVEMVVMLMVEMVLVVEMVVMLMVEMVLVLEMVVMLMVAMVLVVIMTIGKLVCF